MTASVVPIRKRKVEVEQPSERLIRLMDERAELEKQIRALDPEIAELARTYGYSLGYKWALRPEQARELVERGTHV